jgi:hypothetical protein
MDIEGMEIDALQGAADTIRRCRPFLYVENNKGKNRLPLIAAIHSLGYRAYWHGKNTGDPNMLCIPTESPLRIPNMEPVESIT